MWRWRTASLARAGALVWAIAALAVVASATAGAASLPDGRAYELVTPPANKNGADVVAMSERTRVAADGNAVQYASLTAYGDVLGTGVATDYMSLRSSDPRPGTNGWSVHALTPLQQALAVNEAIVFDPLYVGDFSSDLGRGVFRTLSPLTDAPSVAAVPNLYVRTDLRTPGPGAYQLLSACPLCDLNGSPLPAPVDNALQPIYAGASDDFSHILFQQRVNLTSEAPIQPPGCATSSGSCMPRAYEWSAGQVRLVGLVPPGFDTSCGPGGSTCVVALASVVGGSVGAPAGPNRPLNVISADGSRFFFTVPTDNAGNVTNGTQRSGKLYMRTADATTDQLNVSERSGGPLAFSPATYLTSAADGSRVFFLTSEALTDDAPDDGQGKLYMYDATKPPSDPHNVTFLSPATSLVNASEDGRYVYFLLGDQVELWHEGTIAAPIRAISPGDAPEVQNTGANAVTPTHTRVTPNGRHLLLSVHNSDGLRELYVYSADTGVLVCASCGPIDTPTMRDAEVTVRANKGAALTTWHQNRAISDDGSRVFFTAGDALVAQDTNGMQDVYEFDLASGQVHLLTSGADPADSFFLDASPSGDDVFFVTRERLVRWDADTSYDLYDARVGGGFPDPVSLPPSCSGSACQDPHAGPPAVPSVGSSLPHGAGDPVPALKAHATKQCRKGFVKKRVRGKRRCVKRRHHHGERAGGQQLRRTK